MTGAAAVPTDWRRFIQDNTRLLRPPLVPELQLHLADESLPIWQKTEDELGELNLPPPYWAFAWAGGQALARYVLDHAELVAGKRALDLGSGSGLVAIAAMRAGAASALATDLDLLAAVAAELNANANGVVISTSTDDLLDGDPHAFDVILIGDLFYEKPLAARVLAFAKRAVLNRSLVLIGDPSRHYCPVDQLEQCESYSVPVTRELEDAEIKSTAVWRLPPAKARNGG